MTAKRFVLILTVIVAAALGGRIVYAVTAAKSATHSFDEIAYREAAVNLGEGNGYKVHPYYGAQHIVDIADHAPLTATVLAPVARLSGNDENALRVTVALAGGAVVLLVGLLGRLAAGRRAGLVAAGIAAVYPNLWSHDGLLMSETFAALTSAGVLLAIYYFLRAPNGKRSALVGVACGLAALSRGELLLLLPMLAVPATLSIRTLSWPSRARLAAVALVATAAVLAPWFAYNLSRFDRPVLISHQDGAVIVGANCPSTYSGWLLGFWDGRCHGPSHEGDDPTDTDAAARRAGLHYARTHLSRLPIVIAAREGRVWGVYRVNQMTRIAAETEGIPRPVAWAGWVCYWGLVIIAAIGVLRRRIWNVARWPLLVPFALVAVVTAWFYGHTRLRTPAEIALVVLAAVALESIAPQARVSPVSEGSDLTC